MSKIVTQSTADIAYLNRDELLAIQAARVAETFDHAYERIPFYRRKFQAAGLRPGDVRSAADLVKVPLTTKTELRASEEAHPPLGDYRGAPISECIRLSTSSGATGRATVNLMTPGDAEIEYALMARTLKRNGMRPGDISINTHPGYLYGGSEFMSAYHAAYGMISLGFGPLGADDEVVRHLDLMADLRPRAAVLFAPSLLRFRDIARRRRDRDFPADYGIEIMSLNEFAMQFADTRRWFEQLLGVKLFNNFGFSEIFSGTGSSCIVGDGNHINEDYAIVEIVDPRSSELLPDRQVGSVVVTSLGKQNGLLRYAVGDLGYIEPDPCPCGDPSRLFFRLGRESDVLYVEDKPITNADIVRALAGVNGLDTNVLAYQVVIRGSEPLQELRITVPPSAPGTDPSTAEEISADVSRKLGVPALVEIVNGSSFSYKPTRVVRV